MKHPTRVWQAVARRTTVPKTVLAFALLLAMLLAAVAPALAQGPAAATGVLGRAA